MGQKDTLTKEYISRNDIFADIFNYALHQGTPVILPQQLMEKDITEIALPMGKDGKMVPVQRYRDILKALVIKETGDTIYAILGIENQSFVHYAMPVKNLFFKSRISKRIRGRAAQQLCCLLMCSSAIRRRLISVVEMRRLCKALEEQRKIDLEEGRKSGLEEGRKSGLEEGMKKGHKFGLEEGQKAMEKERKNIALQMKKEGFSISLIAKILQLSESGVNQLLS